MPRGPWPAPAARRSRRTTAAGALALAWSSSLASLGLVLLVALPPLIRASERGYCENDDHPGPCANLAELLGPGLLVLAVGIWCVVASVGLLQRRRWGKSAVLVTFMLWATGALIGLLVTAGSSGGLDPPAAIAWLILLAFFVTIVVLAVDPTR
jgi:hypothetical protein